MNYNDLNDNQIRILEAQTREPKFGPSGIHPDRVTIENMSDEQIRNLEAQTREPKFGPSGIHPDRVTIENMSDEQAKMFEAMVLEKRTKDVPYKQYFNNLVENPIVTDEKQFEDATIRSMQSNEIIRIFMSNLIDKISVKTNEFMNVDKNDKNKIASLKLEIEQLMSLYQKYLYKLKQHGWNFNIPGFDLSSMKVPDSILNLLFRLQREYAITFLLPIPVDLGDYYGHEFERQGKMIPGVNLMYDELNGKEINWHQVLIYKENELTPYQMYLQNQEKKRRQFEEARTKEIQDTLGNVQAKSKSINGR